jgi:CBS domain-containing protein
MENDNSVEKWMTKRTVSVPPSKSVADSSKLMKQKNIGSLLITENNKLIGIVTDTDIIQKVVGLNKDPKKVKVSDVMTKNLISITKNFTLLDAIELIYGRKIKRLPVISMHGELQGIITDVDIMSALSKIGRVSELINIVHHLLTHKDSSKGKKVMEVNYWMTKKIKTILEKDSVSDAARLMKQTNCGSLPVVNKKNDVIGIITDTDIIHKIVAKSIDPEKATVDKFMTKRVIITTPQKNIINVAEIMHTRNIRRMPVIQNAKIVGIITTIDIINALFSINNFEQAKELIDVMYK